MSSATEKIRFHCDCGAKIGVPAVAAGKRVRCPKCQSAVRVPPPSDAAEPGGEGEPAIAGGAGLVESLENLMDGETLKLAPEPPPPPAPPKKTVSRGATASGTPRLHLFDGSLDDDAPEGPPVECPCCETQYRAGVKICVACGIDIKTGRAIQTRDDSTLDRTYEILEPTLEWLSIVIRFGYFPVASEAFGLRKPWVIRAIAVVTVLISGWYMYAFLWNKDAPEELALLMMWTGHVKTNEGSVSLYRWYQPLTSAFLHGGPMHLVGNMIFLLVLGARVNALVGNILTLIAYPALAYAAAAAWDISRGNGTPSPALGASGAIMGMAGMYLVLMPVANVHMAGWIRWRLWSEPHVGIWPVRGFWVVLFYISWDVLYTYFGVRSRTAHWAHLGGFIGGVVLALFLLFARLVNARGGDILSALIGRAAWPLIGKPNRPPRTLW